MNGEESLVKGLVQKSCSGAPELHILCIGRNRRKQIGTDYSPAAKRTKSSTPHLPGDRAKGLGAFIT